MIRGRQTNGKRHKSNAKAALFGKLFDPDHVRRCREELERVADLTRYGTSSAAADNPVVFDALGSVAATLMRSRLVVWQFGGHGTDGLLPSSTCRAAIVRSFVATANPEALDVDCANRGPFAPFDLATP